MSSTIEESQPARVTGTKEWSSHSVNCISGCSHNCRYCYARGMALRFKRISAPEDWAEMNVRAADVSKGRRKLDGRVMFPSSHDITPETLEPCKEVLQKLLSAGNEVLIVSKPHISCIESLCRDLALYRDQVIFRFSIGARDESILAYWEPGAPTYAERLACLRLAYGEGYATSVSCEPLLDANDAVGLCDDLTPFITDSIWIGKMNRIRLQVVPGTSRQEIERIEQGQTHDAVLRVHEQLKNNPLVKWKESYKDVLGIDLAGKPGMDI